MDYDDAILEQWIARTLASHPAQAGAILGGEPDPFRNPYGHALRQSLSQLWRQLLGEMDVGALDVALDGIIRIRAVQDMAPSEVLQFLFLLRELIREFSVDYDMKALNDRIDQLILRAFDTYMRCREQIAEIRANEHRRADQVQQRIHTRRPA